MIKEMIQQHIDKKYQSFASSLLPTVNNLLGVRIPQLRKIARNAIKNEDWQHFIDKKQHDSFEETLVHGFIIASIHVTPTQRLQLIADYMPQITNWSTCDSFCSTLKEAKVEQSLYWSFIQQYVHSSEEYEVRFAFVMMLMYFINDSHIDEVIQACQSNKETSYYAMMAVAWCISIAFLHSPPKVEQLLESRLLDKTTHNSAIQKIVDSSRVYEAHKIQIKKLRFK